MAGIKIIEIRNDIPQDRLAASEDVRAIPNSNMQAVSEVKALTLAKLQVLLRSDPPVGAEIAQACDYDAGKLTEWCGCSLGRLEQVFREFRRRPHRWLQEQKLLKDLRRLEQLDATGQLESLKETLMDMGYRHPANFDRAFKKLFGASPSAFLAEREAALKTLGIDLAECRLGRQPYPIIDL